MLRNFRRFLIRKPILTRYIHSRNVTPREFESYEDSYKLGKNSAKEFTIDNQNSMIKDLRDDFGLLGIKDHTILLDIWENHQKSGKAQMSFEHMLQIFERFCTQCEGKSISNMVVMNKQNAKQVELYKKLKKSLLQVLKKQKHGDLYMNYDFTTIQQLEDQEEKNRLMQELADNVNRGELDNESKFPRIGSQAKNLEIIKEEDNEIWDNVLWFIENERWSQTLEEVTDAMDAISHRYESLNLNPVKLDQKLQENIVFNEDLQEREKYIEDLNSKNNYKSTSQIKIQKRYDNVFWRMERIASQTIWEVNQIYYKRLVQAIVRTNRRPEVLLAKIQHHCIYNLSMDYQLETIMDIAEGFVQLDFGSNVFYQNVLHVIAKGHKFHNISPSVYNYFPLSNNYVQKSLNVLEYAKLKHQDSLEIVPDYAQKMVTVLNSRKYEFSLDELVYLGPKIERILGQHPDEQKQLDSNLTKKFIKSIQNEKFSYGEMVYYINFAKSKMSMNEYVSQLSLVDKKISNNEIYTTDIFDLGIALSSLKMIESSSNSQQKLNSSENESNSPYNFIQSLFNNYNQNKKLKEFEKISDEKEKIQKKIIGSVLEQILLKLDKNFMSIDTNTYLMMCDQLETYYKVNNVDESSKKNLEKIYQMKKSNGIGQQNVKAYLIK